MEALVNFFITNRTHEVQKSAEPAVAGIDQSDAYRWSRLPAGMTYEQWKAGKGLSIRSKHVTAKGRVAYSQRGIDEVIERNDIHINWPVRPTYNPRLKTPGKTVCSEILPGVRKIKSIEIGPQVNDKEEELIDTILHETLEARMLLRDDRRLSGGDAEVHPYID